MELKRIQMIYKKIEELRPNPNNPKTHSDTQVDQIARSIQSLGWGNPILIDKTGMIIAGHGRILAAAKLGLREVPCIPKEDLTQEQVIALMIADNKLTENSTWDNDLLSSNIIELKEAQFDISLLGFSDSELSLYQDGWGSEEEPIKDIEESDDPLDSVIKVKCKQEIKKDIVRFLKEQLADYEGVTVE